MKYRKKPVIVDAVQWFKNGDHPEDNCKTMETPLGYLPISEGMIVRYYRAPECAEEAKCKHCGNLMQEHGWIDTPEGGHIVCPGDWVIKGVNGEFYPCKPDVFEKTYEPVNDDCGVDDSDAHIGCDLAQGKDKSIGFSVPNP